MCDMGMPCGDASCGYMSSYIRPVITVSSGAPAGVAPMFEHAKTTPRPVSRCGICGSRDTCEHDKKCAELANEVLTHQRESNVDFDARLGIKQTTLTAELDTMVRDFCAVGPRPKSEVRLRILEFAETFRDKSEADLVAAAWKLTDKVAELRDELDRAHDISAAPEADVWHEGTKSYYRAKLIKKLTPEEAEFDPAEGE